jgi:5'-methylthioinosine phosphorylase
MARIGIIGGTGLNSIDAVRSTGDDVETPYGAASHALGFRTWHAHEVLFLARHGQPHVIAPHRVNYRANLWLLKQAGVDGIIASYAVGGIGSRFGPGVIALPDQLIDYTWGREHTYYDAGGAFDAGGASGPGAPALRHIEFGVPYDPDLQGRLTAAAAHRSVTVVTPATYGATQGPRLETAAEIDRMERDGCDLVGMTGMPEAGLARELDLPFVAVCLVVNAAAGRGDGPINEGEIGRVGRAGMARVIELLDAFFDLLV